MAYEVSLKPGAVEDFEELDRSAQKEIRKQLEKLKEKPQLGKELGVRAGLNLTGFRALRVLKGRYRIVYHILEGLKVEVWAIGKREKLEVYRTLASRLNKRLLR